MVKQPESGYKDTALEIAGKSILKSGYCKLLKSIYCFMFQFFFSAIPHIYIYMSKYLQFHSALYTVLKVLCHEQKLIAAINCLH